MNKEDTKEKFSAYKPTVKLPRRGTAYPRKFQPSTTSTDDIPPSLTGSTSSIDSSSSNDTVPDNDDIFAGVKSNRDQDKKVSQRKASRKPHKSQENKIVKTKPKFKKVIKQTLV